MSELVTDHLEHTLPPAVRLRVRWHLLLCPACRRYFAQMRSTMRLLGRGRLNVPEPEAVERVVGRLPIGDNRSP